jgi:hypothetical protein
MWRSHLEVEESPLCIAHAPPSEQHAMRASGLGAHPAQTGALPANKTRLSATAVRRRATITTPCRMLDRSRGVKPSLLRHDEGASSRPPIGVVEPRRGRPQLKTVKISEPFAPEHRHRQKQGSSARGTSIRPRKPARRCASSPCASTATVMRPRSSATKLGKGLA